MKNIESLLSQIKTISKSYERLNQANGGNFNIFSILRIESDEVTTHSRFIAELLSPHGVHGFGSQFLDLFIETLKIDVQLKTDNCQVIVEANQGKVTDTKGGSIDILVKEHGSEENVIMIENKIYAGEQKNQLLRYYNAFPKGKLLFLTLWGYESENHNTFKDYEPISYSTDIIHWLEECKKISVNNPTLRETLTQYINLIKKLTNQNINTEMNEELMNLFAESRENFYALRDIKNIDMRPFAMKKAVIPAFEELAKEEKFRGFSFETDLAQLSRKYANLCVLENDALRDKNLSILFQFQAKNTNFLIGGFVYNDHSKKSEFDYSKLKQEFKNKFGQIPVIESDRWPSYFHYYYFMNWSNNINDLKNLIFGDEQRGLSFKNDLKFKIEAMLDAVKMSF